MFNKILVCSIVVFITLTTSLSIQAQELSIFAGWKIEYYEDNVKISKEQFEGKIYADPLAGTMWDKSKKQLRNSYILLGAEVGLLLYAVASSDDGDVPTVPIIGVLATGMGSIIYTFKAVKSRKEAVLAYNKAYTYEPFVSPSKNGIGLAYNF